MRIIETINKPAQKKVIPNKIKIRLMEEKELINLRKTMQEISQRKHEE